MPQLTSTTQLRGGLNLVTPAIATPPGFCISAVNYESDVRGYRRVGGYERYDGRPRPSDASYWILHFDAGVAAITEGQTVTGATSAATGKALTDAVVETGSYGGSNAAGYLVLTNVSGTFQNDENLQVTAVTKSVADGLAAQRGSGDATLDAARYQDAIETRRALIAAVPGSGPVRGVQTLHGEVFAIRDNVGATAGVIHKATAAGWVAVTLGSILFFDAGAAAFTEGNAVTGGTSGATGTIRRVVLTSGAWDGSGVGFFVITVNSGTFQNNEAITEDGAPTGAAVTDGVLVANALPAGGRYDFTIHNFYGANIPERMYAANGVGRAFEFDGTYFTPIRTGLSDALDKPERVGKLANHLFLAFPKGSVQFSELGNPLGYQTTLGAGELTFGRSVANFLEATATALVVLGREEVGYITGTDQDTFLLDMVSQDSGAVPWSAQVAGSPVYLDDGGVRRMSTTQAFGNWRVGTITELAQPMFAAKDRGGITATASVRVRALDVYRLFYDDGTAVSVYFGRKNPETMPLLFPFMAYCSCAGQVTGESYDSVFIGAEDGYVYEMDRGTSFDGTEIVAYLRLPFNGVGSPTQEKRWHGVILECDVLAPVTLNLMADFAYMRAYQPPTIEEAFSVTGGGAVWDDGIWDEFVWSSQFVGQAHAFIRGKGQTLSLAILSETTYEEAHTLSALTLHFSYRGLQKLRIDA